MQKEVDRHGDRITELENRNELKGGKISELENELQKIKEENVKDDFALTVTVDSTIVNQGDTVNVNAVLHN